MPDKEHLELMTTEKVVPPLVRVAEHPTVKSLHVLAGIGGAVLAFLVVLVGVFGWLFRVAPFVLTGMVCVLAWLIFCYFWMIPKIKRLIAENKTLKELSTNSPRLNGELETANREITILTVENSALKGEIAQTKEDYEYDSRRFQALYEETETLKAAHQEKLEWNQKVHEGDIRERDAFLQKFEFLVETVSRQREEIDAYVELERFFYCRIDTGTVPTLILAAEIRNRSFFFVELDNSVSGSLQFDDLPLLGDKRFNPHTTPFHIHPTHSKRFTIEVRLTKEEKDYIDSFQAKHHISIEKGLKIHRLILTVKGTSETMDITPKPIRIRDGFKVINSEAYVHANERFSQT